jgi:mono/diheme cytochrome c family protein
VAQRKRRNPWTSVGEVIVWVLFAMLLFPVGFAGWAVGHYTSLGKPSGTKTVTETVTQTQTVTTSAPIVTPPATTAQSTTTSAAATGDPAAGKTVFASSGCAACHTFAPAGASGTVGPDLDTAPAKDAKTAGMSLDAFLRESIVNPDAYVPSGYAKGVMPTTFKSSLSKTQLDDLVAFLASGSK